ncbi:MULTISPECIES: hypothetical protein [Streptomyces]|uniref:hypothetical protein n=1 Tax=Streptomyces TaxID=1883 RepID=UPI0004BD2F3F|nr:MULTISPECIES: hypothetical protein [Streptomyces]KJY18127.1 hypothetical protein VR43_26440 [Streptomyces sp. NRRL S-104]KOU83433.1 hypothetical protein ADK93_27185 [Streptomyces sp. XY58]KOV05046.1 hypothetical protein ADK89_20970 [Streptomyces sp. XY37]KOV46350.1 hypothetical protein ADK99_22305 [Streptomyces sp. MMG1064]
MFLVTQFPIADLRPLLARETRRLDVPCWPLVQSGEFVRSTGPVRARKEGGLVPWRGEGVFCDAASVFRFPPCFSGVTLVPGDERTSGFACAYRRLIADGFVSTRFELAVVGGRSGRRGRARLPSQDFVALLINWLDLPVAITSCGEGDRRSSCHLGQAGRPLTAHMLRATTRFPPAVDRSWLQPGRPLLLAEYSQKEAELPPDAMTVDLGQDIGVRLAHCRISCRGTLVGVWLLERTSPSPDKDALRRLRVHLLRLHTEYECVRLVLRFLTRQAQDGRNTEAVARFLNRGLDLLSSPQRYGFDQNPILAAAYEAEQLVTADEWQTVLHMLSEKRAHELARIDNATYGWARLESDAAAGGGSQPVYIADRIVVAGKGGTVNEFHTRAGGDIHGVIGSGNIVTSSFNRIDSSNLPDEAKVLLKQLTEAVALTASRLPAEEAEQVSRDLTAFQDEALSGTPRRNVLQVFGQSLQKAADFVGDVGAPIANLVTAVIGLIA